MKSLPRFQFSLATLFWATAAIAVAISLVLAVARERYIGKLACMLGLMVLPMVLVTAALMYIDLAKLRTGYPRRSLKPLLIFGVIYGLSLPWLLIWLISYLFSA